MRIVYMHRCIVTGKSYVGITPKTVRSEVFVADMTPEQIAVESQRLMFKRWRGHVSTARKKARTVFHQAIMKYGEDAFEHVVLDVCDSMERAFALEIERIDELKTHVSADGYNMTLGGDCVLLTGDQRQRQRDATKVAMWRPEVRERHLNAQRSQRTRQLHAVATRASWQDPEMRERHVQAMRDSPNVKRHAVEQLDIQTGSVIAEFRSVREASRATGINKSSILNHMAGNQRHSGGFRWRRKGVQSMPDPV